MSPWTLLGIGPTDDKSAIRRAYVRQVKSLGAEPDANAFHRLRDAREAALRGVDAPRVPKPVVDPIQRENGEGTNEAATVDRRDETYVGPRVKIVETDVLDREAERRPLLADDRDLERESEELRATLTERLGPLRDGAPLDLGGLRLILFRMADLPLGGRRNAEQFCLTQIAGHLRKPDGTFDPAGALHARPLALACDDAFGWTFDDEIVHASLASRDAGTLMLMLDMRDDASLRRRPLAARLRRIDAQVLLEMKPRLLSTYKRIAMGGAMPLTFNVWAALFPYLWAIHRRYWAIGAAWYLAMAAAACLAFMRHVDHRALLAVSVALTIGLGLASGLLADRTVFLYAWRWARKADRRGLYEPSARRDFLRKFNTRINGGLFFYFTMMSVWVSMFPYVGLLRVLRLWPW